MTILKILALGNKQIEDGKVILAADVIQQLQSLDVIFQEPRLVKAMQEEMQQLVRRK